MSFCSHWQYRLPKQEVCGLCFYKPLNKIFLKNKHSWPKWFKTMERQIVIFSYSAHLIFSWIICFHLISNNKSKTKKAKSLCWLVRLSVSDEETIYMFLCFVRLQCTKQCTLVMLLIFIIIWSASQEFLDCSDTKITGLSIAEIDFKLVTVEFSVVSFLWTYIANHENHDGPRELNVMLICPILSNIVGKEVSLYLSCSVTHEK